jgi:hypothetical protein
MTGYASKKAAAQAKLEDDDDIQTYTRPWVGLTDEEAQWLYNNCRTPSNLIEMVEAKLKDKNT